MNTLLPWLENIYQDLDSVITRGQVPQAILIHGPLGTGRRHLGLLLAARLLQIPEGRVPGPLEVFAPAEGTAPPLLHPDFLDVQPLPEKNVIAVDQVRDLIAFLQLKSHQGGTRVVLIWPAETMTRAAANSLLKTLEEPPAASVIVLITETTAGLPATVVSRCHRIRVSRPGRAQTLAWLRAEDAQADWGALLDFSGDAPLHALSLHRAGFASSAAAYARDLRQLEEGRDTPAAVAGRWAEGDMDLLLRWLYCRAARSVALAAGTEDAGRQSATEIRPLQNRSKALNIRALLARVREVEDLHRNRSRTLNRELQWSALLQRWYGSTRVSREEV